MIQTLKLPHYFLSWLSMALLVLLSRYTKELSSTNTVFGRDRTLHYNRKL
jgi:hypothetical protein